MIQQDYKSDLYKVKVIVEEAKVARLENSLKKKQIHDGKMNDPIDVRAEKIQEEDETC